MGEKVQGIREHATEFTERSVQMVRGGWLLGDKHLPRTMCCFVTHSAPWFVSKCDLIKHMISVDLGLKRISANSVVEAGVGIVGHEKTNHMALQTVLYCYEMACGCKEELSSDHLYSDVASIKYPCRLPISGCGSRM